MSAPDDPPRFSGSWLMIAVPVVAISLLVSLAIPNFVGGGQSKFNGIINNLRLIDGAKQQWASEHNITDTARVPTERDLIPYVGRVQEFVRPIAGEKYIIKALGEAPEAYLTKYFKEQNLPKGTIIRFNTNGGLECLPLGGQR